MNLIATASECGFALIDLTGPGISALPPSEVFAHRLAEQGYLAVLATPALAETRPDCLPPALPGETNPVTRQAHPAGYALRRRVARALLAAASGRPAERFAISTTESGAPVVAGGPFRISFTTRHPLSAVALAPGAIGIDIETIIPAEAIPWNMLRADETAVLKALPEGEQGAAFARLWAAKEAYAKALGLGFRLEPESLVITPRPERHWIAQHVNNTVSAGSVMVGQLAFPSIPPVVMALALLSS
jgi:4'-phosphopantetheinyl transferase